MKRQLMRQVPQENDMTIYKRLKERQQAYEHVADAPSLENAKLMEEAADLLLTPNKAAKLHGLIQAMVEAALQLHGATEAEVHAGGLDEDYTRAKEKMLDFIRNHTDKGTR